MKILDKQDMLTIFVEEWDAMYTTAHRALQKWPTARARIGAEDVLQETWLTIFDLDRLSSWAVSSEANFRQYLKGIVCHKVADAARKTSDEHRRLRGRIFEKDESCSDEANLTEEFSRLWAAVERLPEIYSTVIQLKYAQGKKYQEIATQLNLPYTTVTKRVSRGVFLLRQELDTF